MFGGSGHPVGFRVVLRLGHCSGWVPRLKALGARAWAEGLIRDGVIIFGDEVSKAKSTPGHKWPRSVGEPRSGALGPWCQAFLVSGRSASQDAWAFPL